MTLGGPRIRNSGDSARGEGGPPRVQITWVPGSIRPYASLWITVQRLLVLNRLGAADFRRTFVRHSVGGATHLSLDSLTTDRFTDTVSLLRLSRVLREPISCFWGSQVSQYPLQAWPSFSDRLVWCWKCLQEGFHSALFALRGLEHCPLHGVALAPFLPCGHAIARGSIGCVPRHPGQCARCGEVFLSAKTARQVGQHHGRDLRLRQLSQWLCEVGQRSWFDLPGPVSSTNERFGKPLQSWRQSLRYVQAPAWWDGPPAPPDGFRCPWRGEVHRYGGPVPSTNAVALPTLSTAEDAVFKAIRRYAVHHVLANRRGWMTKLAACSKGEEVGWLFREQEAMAAMAVLLWWQACLGRASWREWSRRLAPRPGARDQHDAGPISPALLSNDLDAQAFAWVGDRLRVTAALVTWRSAHEAAHAQGTLGRSHGARGESRGEAGRRLAPVWSTSELSSGQWSLCVDAPAQTCLVPAPIVDRPALKLIARARHEATVAVVQAPCIWYAPETQAWRSGAGPTPGSRRDCKRHRLLHAPSTAFVVFPWAKSAKAGYAARCLSLPLAVHAATAREAINALRYAVGHYARHAPAGLSTRPTS